MKTLTKIAFNLSKAFLAFDIIAKSKHIAFFFAFLIKSIDNEIYLYKMLTTNFLQAMLVRRAEQSHQHQQSSNSALLTR